MYVIVQSFPMNIYHHSECRNIYHHSAFLACICEFHRELSFRTYKLYCMHLYTLPNMTRQASLKICKANIKPMTVREHLDMIESAIRKEVSYVNEELHFLVNTKFLSDCRPSEDSTFAFCVDANNVWRCYANGPATSERVRPQRGNYPQRNPQSP